MWTRTACCIPGYLDASENYQPYAQHPDDYRPARRRSSEGDGAFGQVALARAAEIATAKATDAGIGLCLIRHATHMGAIGYFTLEIPAEGMAGIAINIAPQYGLPGSARQGSPPAQSRFRCQDPPTRHVLDMATATQSMGKISLRDTGMALGEGWASTLTETPLSTLTAFIPTALGGQGRRACAVFECLTSLMVANPLIAFLEGAPGGREHAEWAVSLSISQNSAMLATTRARSTGLLRR